MLHPKLAEPGWLPPGVMQRAMFLENRAKVAANSRQDSGVARICPKSPERVSQAVCRAPSYDERT